MIKAFSLIWRYRKILWVTTKNDIKARYAGSTLGIFWAILYPLLFLGVYSMVYVAILQVKVSSMQTSDYIILIFSGLVPFLGFSEALGSGVGSVTSNSTLVKNTLFPIELVPLKAVLSSSVIQIVGTLILVIALGLTGKIGFFILLVPLVFCGQLIFTVGFIWLLSSLNVIVRDLAQVTSVMILFFMMVSPIGYLPNMIPKELQALLFINPLYSIITIYREIMFYNRVPPALETTVFVVMSFITFSVGFFIFTKLKQVFADYV